MLIVIFITLENHTKVFVRNNNATENFVYAKKVNGGNDYGWALIK